MLFIENETSKYIFQMILMTNVNVWTALKVSEY